VTFNSGSVGTVTVAIDGVPSRLCTSRSFPCVYRVAKTSTVSLGASQGLPGISYSFTAWGGGPCDANSNTACTFVMGPSGLTIEADFKGGSMRWGVWTATWALITRMWNLL
jgi:hypothetical protein